MHLPRFCYGNISSLQMGDYAASLVIFSFSRDNCPSILAVRVNVSGYFLPRMGMPNNNC